MVEETNMRWTKLLLALILPLVLLGAQARPTRADAHLTPTDDSFVRDKDGERDTNFDNDVDEILVTAEGFPVGTPVNVGYLRFDLSGIEGDVNAARLRLYNQLGPGPAIQIGLYATTGDDWNGAAAGLGDETTLTFNNAPGEGDLLDQQAGPPDPAWMEFGGTALTDYVVQQIAGDGQVTFRVKMVSTGFVDVSIFEDRENGGGTGNLPELVLEGPQGTSMLYLPFVMNEASAD
jgi:hypothetical protein